MKLPILDSKKIEDCCQELQDKWPVLKSMFEARFPGWTLKLDYTHRTPEKQFELYKKGRSFDATKQAWVVTDDDEVVTYKDGIKRLSNHNHYPARALDVLVVNPQNKIVWDNQAPQWLVMPYFADQLGLTNGGVWKHPVDYPHFEIKLA